MLDEAVSFFLPPVSSMETANKQKQAAITVLKATDLAFAKCDCCGLTEECTEEYIKRVRERFSGRWICGLCAEAVKDEVVRLEKKIGNEEALVQHMSFCKKFKNLSPPPKSPSDELISAVKQLLLKSLDSPRSSPVKKRCFINSEEREKGTVEDGCSFKC